MTRALSVRPATLDDLDTVVELRLALLREYADHPLYAHLRPDAKERAIGLNKAQLSSDRETMFVAVRGTRVVGLLRCVESMASPVLLPERYCYVSSVYVVPGERKKGVLRALMNAAEAWCDARGLTEMRLHNSSTTPSARASWGALGFEVVEEVRRRDVHPRPSANHPSAPRAHAGAR